MRSLDGDPAMERHGRALGGLITNLLSLEMELRNFLADVERRAGKPGLSFAGLFGASTGTEFDDAALTDWSQLGALIGKYNGTVRGVAPQFAIDGQAVTDLRDALAHGRLVLESPGRPLRLFKFSKPKGGKVALVFAETLTPAWFDGWTKRLFREMEKVMEARIEFEERATGRHVAGRGRGRELPVP